MLVELINGTATIKDYQNEVETTIIVTYANRLKITYN